MNEKALQAKGKIDQAILKLDNIESTFTANTADAAIKLANIYKSLKLNSQALAELSDMLED